MNTLDCSQNKLLKNYCDIATLGCGWNIALTSADLAELNASGVGGILICSPITLKASITFTVPVLFLPCGQIITAGYSCVFDASMTAGYQQCFVASLFQVTFGPGSVERVLPEWFGAKGDGVTDDVLSLNLSTDSLRTYGGVVFISPRTYLVKSGISSYSKVSFLGTGPASIIKSGMTLLQGESILNYVGTTGTTTTLTANSHIGDRSFTVADSSIFSVDGFVYVVESDNWAMLHRIKSIDSSTQITVYELVGFSWLSGDTIYNGSWVSDATVENIKFLGTKVSTEHSNDRFEDHAVNCQNAHHITVKNCFFETIGSRAIIFIDKASHCLAQGNEVVITYDRAIESHHKTNGNRIIGNTIEGGLIGISAHGIGTVVSGNTCHGQYGYDSSNTLRGSGIAAGDAFGINIIGNAVHGSQREGMAIGGNVNDSRISENVIAYSVRDGMTVNGNNNSITNNHFYQNGTIVEDACINFVASCSNNLVTGNYFHARVDSSVTTRAVASTFDQTFLNLGANQYINFGGALTILTAGTTYVGWHIGEAEGVRKRYAGSKTWDPGTVANGAVASTTITLSGVNFGDRGTAAFSLAVPAGVFLAPPTVTALNTITITLVNMSGGNYAPGSGTLSADMWRDRFGIGGNNG